LTTLPDNLQNMPHIPDDVILSVHIPKAAGISLWQMFQRAFPERLADVYPDRDPWRNIVDKVEVIHGHFDLHEYLPIARTPRVITFLREPLSRAVSHFYFWLEPPTPNSLAIDHPLYIKHFVEQEPDLERFLLEPGMANLVSSFLKPFDRPEQFWFVGFQEHFAEDVRCLQRLLHLPEVPLPMHNKGERKSRTKIEIAPHIKEQFYEIHAEDKRLYDAMLAFRERSVARYKSSTAAPEDYENLRTQYDQLTLAHDEVLNSLSWRLTSPLRQLRKAIATKK
jgi:hypothetical protein